MLTLIQPRAVPSPRHIAAGLGDASRKEICGLLALLDAARLVKITGALGEAARRKLVSDVTPAADRVAEFANGLMEGPVPTDALRAQLWLGIKRSLGLPGLYPLSMRGLVEEAAAIAVRASEILAPAIADARYESAEADVSIIARAGRKLLRAVPGARKRASSAVKFPDVVAHELAAILESLLAAESRGQLDPEVAAAISKGQQAISTAVIAGGGWAALAGAIGTAGFAPYILAAQLSAVIPFVSGPALTSLLFVMINPITVLAGSAALGYWAISGKVGAAREVAAARVAILLAVRGQCAEAGADTLLNAFRSLQRMSDAHLAHLDKQQREEIRLKAGSITEILSMEIPAASWAAPGLWGNGLVLDEVTDRQDVALAAALTAGDMLYHAAAVDPAVLAAADFSRIAELETPLDLAVCVASFASQGARISLRGYSSEQVVMARLIDEGHDVMLADGATTPGYDLIVDGVQVQVKCGADISLLKEHFAKYPDTPVIADNALALKAQALDEAWAPMVTTITGFDLDQVQSLVDQSLLAATELGDVAVPLYAALIGGARAAHKAWTGQIPMEDLPAWLVIDLTIRGGLAGAGQAGGTMLGLVFLGPAGALVLGPVAGVAALMGAGRAHDLLDMGIRREWRAEVLDAAHNLHTALRAAGDRQIGALTCRLERLRRAGGDRPNPLFAWLEARMADDVIAAMEVRDRMQAPSTMRSTLELLVRASMTDALDPDVLRARDKLAQLLAAKPSTTEAGRDLGMKISDAVRKRARKESH